MEDYVNLVEILKSLPKEVLHYIIFKLMECGAISFPEIATEHVRLLERLRKCDTEEMLKLFLVLLLARLKLFTNKKLKVFSEFSLVSESYCLGELDIWGNFMKC